MTIAFPILIRDFIIRYRFLYIVRFLKVHGSSFCQKAFRSGLSPLPVHLVDDLRKGRPRSAHIKYLAHGFSAVIVDHVGVIWVNAIS